MTKILVLYYSMYGHVESMAEAVSEGARSVEDTQVTLMRVPDLMPEDVAHKSGAKTEQAAPLASVDDLPNYDAIIFGTPTRFGNMCSQMRNFLDQTGGLWHNGGLVGKVGSVFTSTATQHGGHETTIMSFHLTLLHHGMVIVGIPYTCTELMNMKEITGGSPYGGGTLADVDGSRKLSENEKIIARFQGAHVATIAKKISQ